MLADHDIDDLSERVLALLLVDGAMPAEAARILVAELAVQRPDAPALLPVLPLAMAASAIEGMLASEQSRFLAPETWRIAALLAAEVLALQVQPPATPAPTMAALGARLQAEPQALGTDHPAAVVAAGPVGVS